MRRRNLAAVEAFRDRVLDRANLRPGLTFLDVGAGEGVLGLGALTRIGPSLRVTFSDVSAPPLNRMRRSIEALAWAGQCAFALASADRPIGIESGSMDVVGARSALACVADKAAAFAECHRALKPGGRLSIAEPILQDRALELAAQAEFLRANPGHPLASMMDLTQRIQSASYPTSMDAIARNPLTNFSERDLVALLRRAGFVNVHVELHIDVRPLLVTTWNAYLNSSPYPGAPTPAEVMAKRFAADEVAAYEAKMRPIVESGTMQSVDLMAYASADRAGVAPPDEKASSARPRSPGRRGAWPLRRCVLRLRKTGVS